MGMDEESKAAKAGRSSSADDIIKQIMGGGGMDGGMDGGSSAGMDDMVGTRKQSIARSLPQGLQDEIMDQIMHQGQVMRKGRRTWKKNANKPAAKPSPTDAAGAKPNSTDAKAPASYPGFLEQANVAHFSMCFNEGKDGWLGLSKTVPADHQSTCLPSLGKAHWGVGLFGISVASKSSLLETPVKDLCTKKAAGQDSPCGAIIDSGTTVVTGPQEQIDSLLENVCDAWPRCSKDYAALSKAQNDAHAAAMKAYGGTSDPFKIDQVKFTKKEILQNTLADCSTWMKPGSLAEGALDELPTLKFNLCGDGKCKELELPGHMYVIEQSASDLGGAGNATDNYTATYLQGVDPAAVGAIKAKMRALSRGASKVCSPAFDAMEMSTKNAGPAWIFGTPFFYQYKVGYSLAGAQSKSASAMQKGRGGSSNCISFTSTKDSPCDAPDSVKAALVPSKPDAATTSDQSVKIGSLSQSTLSQSADASKQHQPLRIRGPWRRPSFA